MVHVCRINVVETKSAYAGVLISSCKSDVFTLCSQTQEWCHFPDGEVFSLGPTSILAATL